MNDYNQKAINDVYKNAHIALQSISDLLPAVVDDDIKTELKEEYEGYERLIGEISSFMAENGVEPKDVNPFKKAMLWSSIKMKTFFDNSKNQIAVLMIKGTVMGIIELRAMLNESKNLNEQVKPLIEKLIKLEEDYEERLKKFL
jgi:hypothetical protein